MNKENEEKNSNDEDNYPYSGRNNEHYSNNENTKPILVLSIEISKGEKELLRIYSNSQPEKLAYEFCTQHNLDFNSLQLLSNQVSNIIKGNIYKCPHIKEDIDYKSSNGSFSSLNAINNHSKQFENGLQSIHKENHIINKQQTFNQIHNSTRHSLSYLIPTYSSRSKSKKCNQTIRNEEESESMVSEKVIQNKTHNYNHNKSNSKYLNTGERLYFKGKKLQERKEEKINVLKKQLLKSRSAIYTFKPKINTISDQAMRNRISNRLIYNDDNKILNYNQYVSKKINSLKEKHCNNSVYTFTPSISKKSNQIDQAKPKTSVSRHELLYDNYKKQQLDIEVLSNQIYDMNVLFKPQINECSSQYSYSSIPFEERQKYFTNKLAEKKKMLREQFESPEDEKTGQKLFHPEVNSDYNRVPSPPGYNIFNSLYSEALKTRTKKRKNEENRIIEGELNSNCSHVNVDSEDIYENKKSKCFEQIFNLLDRDKDGVITRRSIEIKALPKQIVNILSPIIEELKAEDETLNEDEFVTACFHLFDMLEYIEKKQLLTFTLNKNVHKGLELTKGATISKGKNYYKSRYTQ